MSNQPKYLMIAGMDVQPDKEELFNDVYDTEHVPFLSAVPGVRFAMRYTGQELDMAIGGRTQRLGDGTEPRYYVVYGLESPEVLVSPAWGEAVESGRWPAMVRPYTSNRRHILLERDES
ncbi:hypothetical protein [Amycolatopsis jejuensis]|uniref:hypothetical protein n=1 Tax=Amycolatopsis jejuensis TaxID=330084 RepID=UPI0005257882|nr:hypothetical protein [Amycolatopsis jejuensis]